MATQTIARHTIDMVGANSLIIRGISPVCDCWWLLACFQRRLLPSVVTGSTVFTLMLAVVFSSLLGADSHVVGSALVATCRASFAAAPTMSVVISMKADTPSAIIGFVHLPSWNGSGGVLSESGMLVGCLVVNGWWNLVISF